VNINIKDTTKVFRIESYEKKYEQLWDDFVLNKSINGTFLQSRNFLNYHPEDRFEDCSLLIFNQKDNLVAVIPACKEPKDKTCFFSHKGSTYGGIIIDKKHYSGDSLLEIIEVFEQYLKEHRFTSVYLKITPDILSIESPALLEYLLYYKKYQQYSELNTYIDLKNYDEDILSNFNSTKRKHIKRLAKYNLEFKSLITDSEIIDFYSLLQLNLAKYYAKPIHSLDEIIDFKNRRLVNDVKFYGITHNGKITAAGMLFDFAGVNVIHTQNLSTDPNDNSINSIEYLYYSLIKEYKTKKYKYLSWGISTEDFGNYLNHGLLKNKESYGSTYSINKTFYKKLLLEV